MKENMKWRQALLFTKDGGTCHWTNGHMITIIPITNPSVYGIFTGGHSRTPPQLRKICQDKDEVDAFLGEWDISRTSGWCDHLKVWTKAFLPQLRTEIRTKWEQKPLDQCQQFTVVTQEEQKDHNA